MKRATEANLQLLTPTTTPSLHNGTTGRKRSRPVVSGGRYPLRLREFYRRAGFTQKTFAEAAGYSSGYVSQVENGHVIPSEPFEKRTRVVLQLSDDDNNACWGYPSWRPTDQLTDETEVSGSARGLRVLRPQRG